MLKKVFLFPRKVSPELCLYDENAVDKEKVKDEIRRSVDQISDLPNDLQGKPKISELNASMFPILEVAIAGDIPYKELRNISKIFKGKIKRIRGISRIESFWLLNHQIKIEASLEKLIKNDISILQIHEALNKRNQRTTVGRISF